MDASAEFEGWVQRLTEHLSVDADPATKAWWENYVKDGAPFLGVKMPVVRNTVHRWHQREILGHLEADRHVDLALALFDGQYTEVKLAAIIYLQEILLPLGAIECDRDVNRFASLFADGKIYDWNVCDWFCVKVLGPLIRTEGTVCAERIAGWRKAENLWRARASVVAFVPVAERRVFYGQIAESCRILLRREERFAKTAVGWILREISRHDPGLVHQLVSENIRGFSPESLKNAIKYLDTAVQRRLREQYSGAR
jgi:3-methyladenine DNA glycosylase AlkD